MTPFAGELLPTIAVAAQLTFTVIFMDECSVHT